MEELTKKQELIRKFMAMAEDLGLDPVQQEKFAKEVLRRVEEELGIKFRG
jgi:hypothetical protein